MKSPFSSLLSLASSIAIFLVLFTCCRKANTIKNEPTFNQKNIRFFDEHTSADPGIIAVKNFVKGQDKIYHFTEDLSNRIGLPYWDKSISFDSRNIIAYIPFVRDGQQYVNACLVVNMMATDTTFKILYDWQYASFGFKDMADTVWNAKNMFQLFSMFDNKIFESNEFLITDGRIFNRGEEDHLLVKIKTSNNNRQPYRITDVTVVCTTYEEALLAFRTNSAGDRGTETICTYYVSAGGGNTDLYGTGGGDPGGGGSGSGWGNPCGTNTDTRTGAVNDCGGSPGWQFTITSITSDEPDPYLTDNDPDIMWWNDQTTAFQQQALPSWADMYKNYPKDPVTGWDLPAPQVYALVGGNILNLYNSNPGRYANACALRLSRALNYSGVVIPDVPGQTYKGGDNKYYFLSSAMLYNFMKKTFGDGTIVVSKAQGGLNGVNFNSYLSGNKGIYMMQASYPSKFNALGHATLYDGSNCMKSYDGTHYGDYFNASGGVEKVTLWKLN